MGILDCSTHTVEAPAPQLRGLLLDKRVEKGKRLLDSVGFLSPSRALKELKSVGSPFLSPSLMGVISAFLGLTGVKGAAIIRLCCNGLRLVAVGK